MDLLVKDHETNSDFAREVTMRGLVATVSVVALALIVPLTGCQQSQPKVAASLTAEDVAAVSKIIDDALQSYAAKDVEKHMQAYAVDAITMEFDKRYQGADDIREKHIKPEVAELTVPTFKAADRVVRGQGDLAYVSERNIIEFSDKAGNTFNSDSAWASYVLARQPDGAWKVKQVQFSGPMNWLPNKPEKTPVKR